MSLLVALVSQNKIKDKCEHLYVSFEIYIYEKKGPRINRILYCKSV